jgi:DNA-binding SARP family transcriptional activator/tetratricopeptide (TPR) repeat protein
LGRAAQLIVNATQRTASPSVMTSILRLRTLGGLQLSGPIGEELLGRRNTALAVLVVLADRAPARIRREELLALFWGERTEERARHSLRQELARLRQACGDALEVDTTWVRLADGGIECDAHRFAAAASSGNCHEAVALWTGDFLPGCEDIGAEGFRAWVDVERERLRRLLAHCYERSAAQLEAAQDWPALVDCASGWADRFPLEERAHSCRVAALCKSGRVADAAAAQGAFVRRLRTEMDADPSPAWLAATEEMLRGARGAETRDGQSRAERDPIAVDAAYHDAPPQLIVHRTKRRYLVFAVGAIVAAIAMVGVRIAIARTGRPPSLAIGEITSSLPPDSARGFATLLTIDLARISELDVISDRRMSELAAGRHTDKLDAIARSAGAREILEGVLSRRPDHTLRADLRRTDLASGTTRAAYTLEATDLSELADLISERVARDLGVQAPAGRREGATRSILAYRLYEQGLRAFYERDPAALRFFTAALAEDSAFAMASFYKGLTISSVGDSGDVYLAQALRQAQRTNDRERLLISVTWGRRMADPRVLAWADTLVTRYPSEPDAHLIYAEEMSRRWIPTEALAHFRHALEMDSGNVHAAVPCRACDAADGLIRVYARLDSVAAAERIANIWLRWKPTSAPAWLRYSILLGDNGQYAAAHAATDSAIKYSSDPGVPFQHTVWWFYTGDFASIDRMWRELQQSTKPDVRLDALWTRVIASRTQGRMRDALDGAREFRRYTLETGRGRYSSAVLLEGIVRFETGRYREAAAMFDSSARLQSGVTTFASRLGASRAWDWTHAATAYAAAGDTDALRRIEDSVRVNGLLASERYQRLHYYVHGLRLAAEHHPLEAASFFRQASPDHEGAYVRIYLELARAMLAAGRPSEAIPPLVRALKGPTSAVGLYATRSELQELLGLAYDRSQKPDSAVVQYRHAVDAWRNADPEFAERRARLEARIVTLTKSRVARSD